MTVKSCNRVAVGGHRSGQKEFIVFFIHLKTYFAWSAHAAQKQECRR